MITGTDNLFGLPAVESLLREELDLVPALAARRPAGRALLLQAHASGRALAVDLRHLATTRAHADGGRLHGDVACAADALPLEDDAFQLVVVQHAADALTHPAGFAGELARVLAPGGTLVWFGFNPLSPWHAWLRWQARSGLRVPRVAGADGVRRQVLRAGLAAASIAGVGPCWPGDAHVARTRPLARLRGAWMLVASKQRAVLTPLRPRPLRAHAAPQPALAPSRRVRA